jgi:hypothetical protein
LSQLIVSVKEKWYFSNIWPLVLIALCQIIKWKNMHKKRYE